MNEIVLHGCTPTPLANYLKALGVLRLVAAVDPGARGSWRGDKFVLGTRLERDSVITNFLDHYEPTPVLAPWNGGSGFYENDNKDALRAISSSTNCKFETYRRCITVAESALATMRRDESPKGDDKARLLALVRGTMPEAALEWFDASVVLAGDTPQYPPLLGTGGNDGRLDFTNNFMQRLIEVLPTGDPITSRGSRVWLETALFATAAPGLVRKAIGQFSPGQAGGPNASTGFDAGAVINPWDFVLMIEGALLFAAASARRNADDPAGVLSYPFTVRTVGAGSGSLGEGDVANARGEVWMPLWRQPANHAEIRALLSEGRVAIGRRPANDALDFARAVHHMGGYRGIHSFQRFALVMRSGKAYLATPVARVVVEDKAPNSSLIDDLDHFAWLDRFRQFARGDAAAKRFLSLRRRLEDKIFEISGREPIPAEVQALLVLLGEIQHTLAANKKGQEAVAPVPRLSQRWVLAADDNSPEFRIAAALAGLRGVGEISLPLRAQIFPVHRTQSAWSAPGEEKVRIHRGRKGRLVSLLGTWLDQRLSLMQRMDMRDKPLSSPAGALADDVAAFLQSDRMDERIAALLAGLSLCDIPPDLQRAPSVGSLPSAFALMKLAISTDRELRSLGCLTDDHGLPLPRGMVTALLAGNHGNRAITIAWRRLRSGGLTPFAQGALPTLAGIDPRRAAAALLIPLRWSSTASIAHALLEKPEPEQPLKSDETTT